MKKLAAISLVLAMTAASLAALWTYWKVSSVLLVRSLQRLG